MNSEKFRSTIKRILLEEEQKLNGSPAKQTKRVPEVVHDKDYNSILPHRGINKSEQELLSDLKKIVENINSSYNVIWDDHDDITIMANDLCKIRIIPKWENNFDIEMFIKMTDRVFVSTQTWDQVKEFVRENLSEMEKTLTTVQSSWNKNFDNKKDKEQGKPESNVTEKEVNSKKNKNKDYTEDEVKKEEDLPEAPMKEVDRIKRQSEFKTVPPIKPKKHKDKPSHIVQK